MIMRRDLWMKIGKRGRFCKELCRAVVLPVKFFTSRGVSSGYKEYCFKYRKRDRSGRSVRDLFYYKRRFIMINRVHLCHAGARGICNQDFLFRLIILIFSLTVVHTFSLLSFFVLIPFFGFSQDETKKIKARTITSRVLPAHAPNTLSFCKFA